MEDTNIKHKMGFIKMIKDFCSEITNAIKSAVSTDNGDIGEPDMDDPINLEFFNTVEKIDAKYTKVNDAEKIGNNVKEDNRGNIAKNIKSKNKNIEDNNIDRS